MTGKALIKILKARGWQLDRIKGSHHIMVKEGRRAIPVPVHGSKDLPKGLVKAILTQAERKEGLK
jgi:predicted RNA binding protein YcfA (HicA-like mRNA interferase family)